MCVQITQRQDIKGDQIVNSRAAPNPNKHIGVLSCPAPQNSFINSAPTEDHAKGSFVESPGGLVNNPIHHCQSPY